LTPSKTAVYTGASRTVALTPTKPFSLTKPVQLLVYGTGPAALKDSYGRLIDGDHNGKAGGNAVVVLSSSGAKLTAVPQAQVKHVAVHSTVVDALLARNELADLRHRLRAMRSSIK
jgi:hypothetical protein